MKPKKPNTLARRRGAALTGAEKRMRRRNPIGSGVRLTKPNQIRNLILVITVNMGKKLGNERIIA